MDEQIAQRNIILQAWINFLSGVVFLVPVITLFYQYTSLSLAEIILISNVSTLIIWIFELPTSVFADTSGRKKSLAISVICNFLSALVILVFPSLTGFIVASILSGFYWSFWSGTGQAFLEENLRILGKEKEFGKIIGNLMALETFAGIITPLIAAILLKMLGNNGYTILAILDVISALALVILTMQLKEIGFVPEKLGTFKKVLFKNYETAKNALKNVFTNKQLKILLIYRSLANHVAFFLIIALPILVANGMPEWFGGVISAIAGIGTMIANKYSYKIGEKKSYNFVWVISTIVQAILLISAGFLLKSWILTATIFVLFSFFDGLWAPAWNHVLVEQTKGIAIATTRSIIFSIFALYTTVGKQLLSYFSVEYALIGIGVFILIVNIIWGKKILKLNNDKKIIL